jgi:hypothetical protein
MITINILNLDLRNANIVFAANHNSRVFSRKFATKIISSKKQTVLGSKIRASSTVSDGKLK